MKPTPPGRVVFGSSQKRRIFPVQNAPDRMGNQLSRPDAPHLGPGCYNNHEFGTIIQALQNKPGSQRGYGSCANTAARFIPTKQAVTPSPQQYQPDQNRSTVPPPGKTPFGSTARRFIRVPRTAEETPGPAVFYVHEVTHKKVSWPMCFGRPDWSKLPPLEKKSLRGKLTSERDFLKQRS
ncbi:protein pitchfork-like [Melanotaenia boesemani]|uniref:protein pitchfork-like n=1 Tax=Melanotaenia boesemani TaxID=1250792 RepID=UPI001C048969|nr:protein pitchfork-like [Melanotaenia boesemani]